MKITDGTTAEDLRAEARVGLGVYIHFGRLMFAPSEVEAIAELLDAKDIEIAQLKKSFAESQGETRLALALLRAAEDECDRYREALEQIMNGRYQGGNAQTVARDALCAESVKS